MGKSSSHKAFSMPSFLKNSLTQLLPKIMHPKYFSTEELT